MDALDIKKPSKEEQRLGRPVSIIPIATEITTQAAAKLLGCSRTHVVNFLEEGKIGYTKAGKHRRAKYEDVVSYRNKIKSRQKKLIEEVVKADEESGLYETMNVRPL